MAKIFLSYQRDREGFAKTLSADIEALGHTVWFDHKLSGGQHWWNQILAAIRECDVFVFLLDPKSLASAPCQREYGYANSLHKRILPILAGDGVSLHLLPSELSQIQFVDLRERNPDAILRLARAFISLPAAEMPPDPLPPPPDVPLSPLSRLAEQIDGPAPLTLEAQSVLLLDLKRSLSDSALASDAASLLGTMRRRPELLASIAAEIDALPKSHSTPPPPPGAEPDPNEYTLNDEQVAKRAFWLGSIAGAISVLISSYHYSRNTFTIFDGLAGVVTGVGAGLSVVIIGVSRLTMLLLLFGAIAAATAWVAFKSGQSPGASISTAVAYVAPIGAVVTAIGHRVFTWWRNLH
jgi:TIR domain-containing protein